jgi:asparagine synthase (glutamine-hydrolysing)
MRVSLEARVPLLDHEIAEFAFSLPSRLKFRDGVGKWVLRRAIEDLVPASVLSKPKQGFGVPLDKWFKGPLAHRLDALRRPGNPIFAYVDHAATGRLLREHAVGRRDHSYALWRLLVLSLWMQSERLQ